MNFSSLWQKFGPFDWAWQEAFQLVAVPLLTIAQSIRVTSNDFDDAEGASKRTPSLRGLWMPRQDQVTDSEGTMAEDSLGHQFRSVLRQLEIESE